MKSKEKYCNLIFKDGFIVRLKNRRIVVQERHDNYSIYMAFCHPTGTDLSQYKTVVKNRITVLQFLMTKEAYTEFVGGAIGYLQSKEAITFTYQGQDQNPAEKSFDNSHSGTEDEVINLIGRYVETTNPTTLEIKTDNVNKFSADILRLIELKEEAAFNAGRKGGYDSCLWDKTDTHRHKLTNDSFDCYEDYKNRKQEQ